MTVTDRPTGYAQIPMHSSGQVQPQSPVPRVAQAPRLVRPQGWPDELMGELSLRVDVRGARSVAVEQFHSGALRVVRPLYLDTSGQVCYTVINPGGGYVAGDDYLMEMDVLPGASMLLTSQAATKIYRTAGQPVRQHTNARVGAGALFESIPDQIIAYRDAVYIQTSTVEVDPEGSYIAGEVVTPGWAPDGSLFEYEKIVLRTDVIRPGQSVPVLVDALVLEPSAMDVSGLGGLDSHTHVGTLLAVDRRVDADLVREIGEFAERFPELLVGVSLALGPALALRVLGNNTEVITNLLLDVDAHLRRRWFNQDRIDFRKQ